MFKNIINELRSWAFSAGLKHEDFAITIHVKTDYDRQLLARRLYEEIAPLRLRTPEDVFDKGNFLGVPFEIKTDALQRDLAL